MRADVAIVGAGLFGSSLAVALAREGMRVELHDKATPASGDTGRSFGMVRAHYSNEVTVRLAKGGRIVNGVGADTDIVVASAKAYISALNKLASKVERLNPQHQL